MRYIIITIHGTFDKNSKFIRQDSDFCRWIKEDLPGVVIIPFDWSGENSLKDRQLAGYELAKRIKEFGERNSKFRIILLAHSHGGNIIRYAISYPGIEQYVYKIVYMATPVLSLTKKDTYFSIFKEDTTLVRGALYLLIFVPVYLFWKMSRNLLSPVLETNWGYIISPIFYILVFGLGMYMYYELKEYWEKVVTKFHVDSKVFLDQEARANQSKIPMLLVTYKWDEAYVGLNAISRIIDYPVPILITFILGLSFLPLLCIVLILEEFGANLFFLIMFFVVLLVDIFYVPNGTEYHFLLALLDTFIFLIGYIVGFGFLCILLYIFYFIWNIVSILSKHHKFGYGTGLFWLLFSFEYKVRPLKEVYPHAEVLNYSFKEDFGFKKYITDLVGFKLLHSRVYQNENIAKKISSWINN